MLDAHTKKSLFKMLDKVRCGSLELTTPEGEVYHFEGAEAGSHAKVKLHDWKVVRNVASKGDIGFADDYRNGLWECDDIAAVLEFCITNQEAIGGFISGNRVSQLLATLSYYLRLNTRRGSKKNIMAHYDLGNDFYSLWLDPSMTYSSALYQNPGETLQSAQANKYDRILDRLGNPGSVIEIGCGWGGFAERAVERDHSVKGITLSDAQYDFATARLASFGRQANIVKEDYRLQQGRFDNIVSIEMFEAVGERFWPTFFKKMGSLLNPSGSLMLQTITIRDDLFDAYRKSGDAMRTYIFPGGMLPSEQKFAQVAGKEGLRVTDIHRFGMDYATTLRQWLKNFEAKLPEIRQLGYDEPFIRLWRYYLNACIAGFTTGRINLMQAELKHA